MAQFTTRVELHNADWNDYVKLHAEMRLRGFSQTIKARDGKFYELPPAEYDYTGAETLADVLTKARAAASAVKVSHGVIVTESNGRTWQGLKQIN